MKPSVLPVTNMVPSGLNTATSGCVLAPNVTCAHTGTSCVCYIEGQEKHMSCDWSAGGGGGGSGGGSGGGGGDNRTGEGRASWYRISQCAHINTTSIVEAAECYERQHQATCARSRRAPLKPGWLGRPPPHHVHSLLCHGTSRTHSLAVAVPGSAACGGAGGGASRQVGGGVVGAGAGTGAGPGTGALLLLLLLSLLPSPLLLPPAQPLPLLTLLQAGRQADREAGSE